MHRKNTGTKEAKIFTAVIGQAECQVIFLMTFVPKVPHFLEWRCGVSSSSHPVLGLFWPLVASSHHLLTRTQLIRSVPVISKILNVDLPSGLLTDVHLNPNSVHFAHCPSFEFFLVIKRMTFVESLLHVRFHTEGFTWGPRWTPPDSQAPVSVPPLDAWWQWGEGCYNSL